MGTQTTADGGGGVKRPAVGSICPGIPHPTDPYTFMVPERSPWDIPVPRWDGTEWLTIGDMPIDQVFRRPYDKERWQRINITRVLPDGTLEPWEMWERVE